MLYVIKPSCNQKGHIIINNIDYMNIEYTKHTTLIWIKLLLQECNVKQEK